MSLSIVDPPFTSLAMKGKNRKIASQQYFLVGKLEITLIGIVIKYIFNIFQCFTLENLLLKSFIRVQIHIFFIHNKTHIRELLFSLFADNSTGHKLHRQLTKYEKQ